MAENLVSIFEIAEAFGVPLPTIYNWISTKKMPSHLVGGKWMFDPKQIEEWAKGAGITPVRPIRTSSPS